MNPIRVYYFCSLIGSCQQCNMMTSSNGNIFRVTGHLCEEFTGPRWIPRQRPVTQSFDVFVVLRLNKRLSKQSWGWWFETLSRPLWRHRNENYHKRCMRNIVQQLRLLSYKGLEPYFRGFWVLWLRLIKCIVISWYASIIQWLLFDKHR